MLFERILTLVLSIAISTGASYALLRTGRFLRFGNIGFFLIVYPIAYAVVIEFQPGFFVACVLLGVAELAIESFVSRRNRKME